MTIEIGLTEFDPQGREGVRRVTDPRAVESGASAWNASWTRSRREEFRLVGDRSPVWGVLADLAGENAAVEPFDVERRNPETWIRRAVRPCDYRP